jgi:hypothetical protein
MARQIEEIDNGSWRSPVTSIEAEMTGEEFLKRFKDGAQESHAGRSAHV